jgi:deoxyribonuclease V
MKIPTLHDWTMTTREAKALQETLTGQIVTSGTLGDWKTLAAADISFTRRSPILYAAVVVVERGTLNVVERAGIAAPAAFPYVPGLLSFREIPAVIEAFRLLKTTPDIVLVDGHGIAHPRRIGIASHLGLWLDRPTIGCAKSRLCGKFDPPGPDRGDRSPLMDKGEVIGAVLRTKDRVNPLFVSTGHLCDLESCVELVLSLTGKYRLPGPTRMVHEYVNQVRREATAEAAEPEPSG